MNEKEQLIKEIEQAPDFLLKEVLDFLLFIKVLPISFCQSVGDR